MDEDKIFNTYNVIDTIIGRPDCHKIFLQIVRYYQYKSAEDDILRIMVIINCDKDDIEKILTYKNKSGNTIIHIAASYHYKKLLRYLLNYTAVKVGPNTDGKYPIDLYKAAKFKNRLASVSNKQ